MNQLRCEIYDADDLLLVALPLPREAVIEGEHGEVKEFYSEAAAVNSGRAATFALLAADGEELPRGLIIEPEERVAYGVYALKNTAITRGEIVKCNVRLRAAQRQVRVD